MPQPFEQAVLTSKGEELLAKVTAGQGQIEYVCMSIGSGVYSAAEKEQEALKERVGLKAEKNRYTFSTVCVENKAVRLTALLTNQDPLTSEGLVEEGYYINEVGIFAKEPGTDNSAAVLYSICVTAGDMGVGDYMPAFDGHNRSEITQDYILSVDDSLIINVNRLGAVALAKDLTDHIKNTTIHITSTERENWNAAASLLNAITAGGVITDVQIVDALPADAASHPTTFYWVRG